MARVPNVTQDELDPEYQDLVISSLQPGKRINVYSALGNNPPLLSGFREFLGSLWSHSGLSDRQREIGVPHRRLGDERRVRVALARQHRY